MKKINRFCIVVELTTGLHVISCKGISWDKAVQKIQTIYDKMEQKDAEWVDIEDPDGFNVIRKEKILSFKIEEITA